MQVCREKGEKHIDGVREAVVDEVKGVQGEEGFIPASPAGAGRLDHTFSGIRPHTANIILFRREEVERLSLMML
jgi:hypothetical protein